jgi:hypothetical protein
MDPVNHDRTENRPPRSHRIKVNGIEIARQVRVHLLICEGKGPCVQQEWKLLLHLVSSLVEAAFDLHCQQVTESRDGAIGMRANRTCAPCWLVYSQMLRPERGMLTWLRLQCT